MTHVHVSTAFAVLFASISFGSEPGKLPEADTRAKEVRTLNTPRQFPAVTTKAAWQKRAKEIREQARVSCGLWPMPEKTPLKARIFDPIERDGYSVEKAYIET